MPGTTYPSTTDPTSSHLDTWLVEDKIHLRRFVNFNKKDNDTESDRPVHGHMINPLERTHAVTRHEERELQLLEQEAAAVDLALDASRRDAEEHDRQVLAQQRRLEDEFGRRKRERDRVLMAARERAAGRQRQQQQQQQQQWVERGQEREREREREREKETMRRELENQEEEKERSAARIRLAKRAAAERKIREQEEMLRQAEVMVRNEEKMEEAAIAMAVKESLVSERARELKVEEEREKREKEKERHRIAAVVAERMRREEEAQKLQQEAPHARLQQLRWEEGKTAKRQWTWTDSPARRQAIQSHLGEEIKRTAPSRFSRSYSRDGIGGTWGDLSPLTAPHWGPDTLPQTTTARQTYVESGKDTRGFRRWKSETSESNTCRVEDIETEAWRDEWEDARRWRKTTTEHWGEITTWKEEGQNGEVHNSGRRYS